MLEVWRGVHNALATTHQVISYDRRGHGRSPNGTSDVRVHARDAAALIERVAGEPVVVVGWSGGAGVAMELIRTHSEQVRAAVLIEPNFHLPSVQPLPAVRLLLAVKLDALLGRKRSAAERMARFAFARRSGLAGSTIEIRLASAPAGSWSVKRSGARTSRPLTAPPRTAVAPIRSRYGGRGSDG